jgi:hypothetical protein
MTLEELREYLEHDQAVFRVLQNKAIQTRGMEVDEEVEKLKKEHQMSRVYNKEQDEEMEKLMKVVEGKKENELKAKIEKERIEAELKVLERSKLGYLEAEKKRELQRLAAERSNIQKREESLIKEINDLSTKMTPNQKVNVKATKALTPADILKKRELDITKERAVKIAELR